MPQISKIRIANFSYNDGKRLIADELFDFANKEDKNALNTLVNLKNGGGKSLLSRECRATSLKNDDKNN